MADENPALEAFLTAGSATEAPPPPPPDPSQATQPEPTSKPDPKRATEAKPQQAPAAAAEPPADEDDHDDGSGTVPIAALRKTREDYKIRAARAEGELAGLRAQLEAATRPPAQPAEQPRARRQPPPNPAQDPDGFYAWMQSELVDRTLNTSEAALRRQIGAEAVREVQTAFRAAATADPSLWNKLYDQPDPYEWAHQHVQQQRVISEIGSDPDAYKNKLRAEIEAQVRAELGTAPAAPQSSPAAGIPPSLANVRSSAPRGQVFSGPPSMDDIVGRRSGDIFAKQR
jgi:hypothetical protein